MTKKKTNPTTPEKTARDVSSPWPLQGSTLIGLVVAIMVFSVLAAAIVPMISSSSQQTGAANMSAKAYLLAESGFRYAASTYLHAGDTESIKNDTLEALDGSYTLSDGNSRFELKIFSYFYEVVSDIASGDTQFDARTPGTFPNGELSDGDGGVFLDPGLEIEIEGQFYTLTSDSQPVQGEDDKVTLAVTTPLPFYPAGTLAYPVATAVTATISKGGDLVYQNGHGRMFPLRNGRIRVNGGHLLTYRYNDRATNRFVDVRDPQDDAMKDYPVGTRITLTKFVRLQSTGIYGSGSMQARRQVTYHTPLPVPETATQQKAFTDRFDSSDPKRNWTDTAGTYTSVGPADGNSALRVDDNTGSDQGSLTAFNPTTTAAQEIDFNASSRGSRGFLSYDIQAKFGFENTPEPSQGFDPPTSSIPRYFAAGLSFRLRNAASGLFSSNGYGVSFLRGHRGTTDDGMPDEFVPVDDQAAIVLWKQKQNESGGMDRTWLAYKQMMDLTFNEDNEDAGDDQFSEINDGTENLWKIQEGASTRQRNGSTRNWHYGRGVTGDYDTGILPNMGMIQSDPVTLAPGYSKITLKFYGWHQTEPARPGFDLNDFDRKEVIIVSNGGVTLDTYTIGTSAAPGDWYQEEIDLTGFAGQTIRIRFKFDTVDEDNNGYEGWYIDDVQIVSEWPIQNSTLAVNLQEAMVVRFANGTPEIRQGDKISNFRGTIGTVMAPPLLTGGDWSSSLPAEGTLLLNRTAFINRMNAFLEGDQLTVVGGTGRAVVAEAGYDPNKDLKANIIKVHFASENGIGKPNTNPVDQNAQSYSRLGSSDTLQWPPTVDGEGNWTDDDGNFTTTEDFFRLIQWDAVDPAAHAINFRTNDQGLILNAVIQNQDDALQSPAFPGILTEAEIGLHAFGDGVANAYFDDFGIRIQVSSDDTVPPPLQQ